MIWGVRPSIDKCDLACDARMRRPRPDRPMRYVLSCCCVPLIAAACSAPLRLEDLPGRQQYSRPRSEQASSPGEPPILLDAALTLGGAPIVHRLPSEQEINTPVPLYFEPPPGVVLKAATVRYKPFGATHYKTLPMRKFGAGFACEISCIDVTTTGDIKYFIEIVDDGDQPLESLGSSAAPLRVHIRNDLAGGPPSLPKMNPPRQCAPTED